MRQREEGGGGLSRGKIAGIVVGAVIGALMIFLLGYFVGDHIRKKKSSRLETIQFPPLQEQRGGEANGREVKS
jgi:hypothetical protein